MKLILLALIPFALSASVAKDDNNAMSAAAATTTTITTTTTTEQESCISHLCREDGLFPEGSCDPSFCQCIHGVGVLKHCSEGTFFHPEYLVCDFPWDIPGCVDGRHYGHHNGGHDHDGGHHHGHDKDPTARPGTTTTITTTTPEQESCISHICKEDGLFPEGSCEESFCQCTHGVGILKHCFEGTFFHPEYLVCDFPWDIPGCAASQRL